MKSVVGAIAVAAMVSTSAFAGANDGALAPGKPAGVKNADISTGFLLIGAISIAAIAAAVIVVSNQSGNQTGGTSFTTATTAP